MGTSPTLTDGQFQWLHEGHVLAGQLRAVTPGHTAWVGIYPLDLKQPYTHTLLKQAGLAILPGAEVRAYNIRLFEISDALRDTWFGENDMKRKHEVVVIGDDHLVQKLESLRVPLEILDSPRMVDYPL